MIAGCALAGWPTRVIGISADESSASLETIGSRVAARVSRSLLGCGDGRFAAAAVDVDDGFVGEGYGKPTAASREAIEMLARHEAIFLDPTYTAKAMAGLIVRRGEFERTDGALLAHRRIVELFGILELGQVAKINERVRVTSLTFLGAARTVTGSKYLLDTGASKVLIDAGLFQGLKELRERNWLPFPIPATDIDAIVLTHAHLDHCGYLPRLVAQGFRGRVFCTAGTFDLCRIVLAGCRTHSGGRCG